MKIWTNTEFSGICPLAVAAVVQAETADDAVELLNETLKARGLKGDAKSEHMVEFPTSLGPVAVILVDGDY